MIDCTWKDLASLNLAANVQWMNECTVLSGKARGFQESVFRWTINGFKARMPPASVLDLSEFSILVWKNESQQNATNLNRIITTVLGSSLEEKMRDLSFPRISSISCVKQQVLSSASCVIFCLPVRRQARAYRHNDVSVARVGLTARQSYKGNKITVTIADRREREQRHHVWESCCYCCCGIDHILHCSSPPRSFC